MGNATGIAKQIVACDAAGFVSGAIGYLIQTLSIVVSASEAIDAALTSEICGQIS